MRVRTVLAAISAAILCSFALRLLYYNIKPAGFVPYWPAAEKIASVPGWVTPAILLFCGIILFFFGWVSARWNWAGDWKKSLQVGAAMGALAGCLIFDYMGVFWFGIKGQSEVLRNFYHPLLPMDGIRILYEAVYQTGILLYTNFILTVFVCGSIGGLGGVASALVDREDTWGSDPRSPQGWLFRLPAYLLTFFGFVNLVIVLAALTPLRDSLLHGAAEYADRYNAELDLASSAQLFQVASSLTYWLFVFLPAGITWGWIFRIWRIRKRPGIASGLWVLLTSIGFIILLYFIAPVFFSSPVDILSYLFACATGVAIGYFSEQKAEGFPYRLTDWAGYSLTYGVLAGTQFIMGVMAYSLALVLISIVNVPHLRGSGLVDQIPSRQVNTFFGVQSAIGLAAILVNIVIGLAIAGFVSFIRTVMGVRDVSTIQEEV